MYKKREIVAAYCRSLNLEDQATKDAAMSLQSMLNRDLLTGFRPEGAGKTAALRYSIEEACFAAVILSLKEFSFSHEVAKGLRPGFFVGLTPEALDYIRADHPAILSLRFGHIAKRRLDRVKPYVWCALHPEGKRADWTPYLPDTRPPPTVNTVSFQAPWPITDLLRSFIFNLESAE